MIPETVYVLHKNGAENHYIALKELLNSKNSQLKHREFGVFTKLLKALKTGDIKLFKKQFINLFFLISLFLTRNKKIVVGIAPYDYQLGFLLKLLDKHEVYYHTSWTCWDKSFYPKKKRITEKVFSKWEYFLQEKAKRIYCVTDFAKKEILKNYSIPANKIEVVYHSVDPYFLKKNKTQRKPNSFIYAGRLIEEKGISEILTFFRNHSNLDLTIIGKGKHENLVRHYSKNFSNINFKGYITDKSKMAKEFSEHEYFILNSKKTERWEELFGMVLIESMSQGVIPIASKHSGPKEIISNKNGYLYNEGSLASEIINVINNNGKRTELSEICIQESGKFLPERLALNWSSILN